MATRITNRLAFDAPSESRLTPEIAQVAFEAFAAAMAGERPPSKAEIRRRIRAAHLARSIAAQGADLTGLIDEALERRPRLPTKARRRARNE